VGLINQAPTTEVGLIDQATATTTDVGLMNQAPTSFFFELPVN